MNRLLLLLITSAIINSSCNLGDRYDISSEDKYEKSKESLAKTESKYPERFLKVSGSNKKNFFGQTVVNGVIVNTAKIVIFKDVALKFSFYSKTGALLEEDSQTIYETVHPGGSKSFKTKYFTPKGTDSVALKVMTAKF